MKILTLTDKKLVMKHQPTKIRTLWLGALLFVFVIYQLSLYLYKVFFIPAFLSQQRWDTNLIYGVFLIFLMALAISELSTPAVTCNFYKNINQVVIEYKGLRTSKVIEYSFADILRADIEEYQERWGTVGRPILILKSQKTIPIHKDYINAQDVRHDIYTINNFIEAYK
ncbi:hypothetical protein [Cylindrospermum sp. FACHB-282]|uniref:hypothetical protein n=1 Tax=Cylindrospermum sp. FACHB-282 TaxID=2692794 RepID=UPI001685823F|nr:hypothetical protein [Cylindrospermum sp. FACHB-282]MBD2385921.1 hypothetical protein [Cylindrospermum sp. FACHB-282]